MHQPCNPLFKRQSRVEFAVSANDLGHQTLIPQLEPQIQQFRHIEKWDLDLVRNILDQIALHPARLQHQLQFAGKVEIRDLQVQIHAVDGAVRIT